MNLKEKQFELYQLSIQLFPEFSAQLETLSKEEDFQEMVSEYQQCQMALLKRAEKDNNVDLYCEALRELKQEISTHIIKHLNQ